MRILAPFVAGILATIWTIIILTLLKDFNRFKQSYGKEFQWKYVKEWVRHSRTDLVSALIIFFVVVVLLIIFFMVVVLLIVASVLK